MSASVPYHPTSQAMLPSALGARVSLNRELGIPYQNSLLLSKQSFYVRVVNNQFKLPLPLPAYAEQDPDPAITVNGKFAVLDTAVSVPWITFTAWMGYGEVGTDVGDPWDSKSLETGDILVNRTTGRLVRIGTSPTVTDTDYPTLDNTYSELILDGTLALLSELITDRVDDLPDVVNDTSSDVNFIPRTIISGLEPMLRGFTI